jgi:hypothetical protein
MFGLLRAVAGGEMMIDLKPLFGEPYVDRVIETVQKDAAGTVIGTTTVTEQVKNLEFVANGFVFSFVLITVFYVVVRTFFPARRG